MKRALPYLTTGHNSKRLILWKMLFFSLLGAYCIFYSPYGINETDGGFITGLAWQIVQGKMLYGDILYVRPPLPVWLRAGELLFLPDGWAIIGERWIFYLKIAAYSWLGACLLLDGHRRWMLAIFGFVVSVHSYPPMAWHTVDGILFSVLGIWCLARQDSSIGIVAGAAAVFAAALCKQSFYPIPLLFAALLLLEKNRRRTGWGIGALLFFAILFYIGLIYNNINIPYFQLTGGAASGSQAIRHGLFDYFRIKPVVALLSLPLLIPALWCFWKKIPLAAAGRAWYAWLLLLCATFAVEVGQRGEFTAPFAQARLMFWVAIFYTMFFVNEHRSLATNATGRNLITLLAICWCASVSWGYNLPILFSTPWVFAAMQISWFFQGAGERAKLQEEKEKRRKELIFKVLRFFQRIIFCAETRPLCYWYCCSSFAGGTNLFTVTGDEVK
ncbi:MAG: hypothetical protein IPJ82_16075 [Lewinellaceae bacterium]|nr:hypothetical protein [Lewinellaceae bacterium]